MLYKGNTKLSNINARNRSIGQIYKGSTLLFEKVKPVTLTVVTEPVDAACVLTYDGQAHTSKSATVPQGTTIDWKVSAGNYYEQTGQLMLQEDYTLNVKLTAVCVAYYTPIYYADGSTKTAEEVKVGDTIVGYNESLQKFVNVRVLNTYQKYATKLIKVKTSNKELDITPNHPILTDQGWASYDFTNDLYDTYEMPRIKLDESLKVLTPGGYKQILSIEPFEIEEPMKVYTYDTTNEVDTYVAAGLVLHNYYL